MNEIRSIAIKIKEAKGTAFLVGGAVRDMILNKNPKDYDIEVFGLQPHELVKVIASLGKVSEVGKSFGVIKLTLSNGRELDLSFPRTDSKNENGGHKGFDIKVDPFMSVGEASRRRDFTINAIYYDIVEGKFVDPQGGIEDLTGQLLRVTDKVLFADDPLRALRALQFVGRFQLEIEQESRSIIKSMQPFLTSLPKERLLEEWKKLLLKSINPALGMEWGRDLTLYDEIHSELISLEDELSPSLSHTKWDETLKVVNKASASLKGMPFSEDTKLVIMFCAVCHLMDVYLNFDNQLVNSATFLKSLGVDNKTFDKVTNILKHQFFLTRVTPNTLKDKVFIRGLLRELSRLIFPATLEEFFLHLNNLSFQGDVVRKVKEEAELLNLLDKPAPDVIQGRHLINLGFKPGVEFSHVIKKANAMQDRFGHEQDHILNLIETDADLIKVIKRFEKELDTKKKRF